MYFLLTLYCNVHIVSMHVKYLSAWETNRTGTAVLAHMQLGSFIQTVLQMSLT